MTDRRKKHSTRTEPVGIDVQPGTTNAPVEQTFKSICHHGGAGPDGARFQCRHREL